MWAALGVAVHLGPRWEGLAVPLGPSQGERQASCGLLITQTVGLRKEGAEETISSTRRGN